MWLIGGESNNNHLVDRSCEHLTSKPNTTLFVAHGVDCPIKVKLVDVICNLTLIRELQNQVSRRLVLLLFNRISHQVLAELPMSLIVLPFENQALDFAQMLFASFDSGVVWASGPIGLLVELNHLLIGLAEYHRAKPAVAHRQRVFPLVSRLAIPQYLCRIQVGAVACRREQRATDEHTCSEATERTKPFQRCNATCHQNISSRYVDVN